MAVNRYASPCVVCGARVPARGGSLSKSGGRWEVSHLACAESGEPRVIVTTFSSGESVYQNSRGRCEDAPCCGCCSY